MKKLLCALLLTSSAASYALPGNVPTSSNSVGVASIRGNFIQLLSTQEIVIPQYQFGKVRLIGGIILDGVTEQQIKKLH